VVRGNGDIVAGLDEFVLGEPDGVLLDNFLGEGLRDARGCFEGREDGIGGGIGGELRVEDFGARAGGCAGE
jgi:hypothetical protein